MNATPVVVHLHHGAVPMVTVTLFAMAFLALSMSRFVFAGLRRRPVRAIAARQEQNNLLELEPYNLVQTGRAMIAADRFDNSLDGVDSMDRENRSKAYLHRIVALTGSTPTRNGYVLDVGKARFYVRYRRVGRVKDLTDPKSAEDETCFYPMQEGMRKAEEIATALLQLKNNPALFSRWAAQSGAFKADGQVLTRAQ